MAKNRIYILDDLRGLAIIYMIIYHTFYSMANLFDISKGSDFFSRIQPFWPLCSGIFILLCGVSCKLSKNNFKRGFKLLVVAMAISLVTYFIPEQAIYFGILHLLSISILIYALTHKLLDKVNIWAGIIISVILFIITLNIDAGYIGIANLFTFDIPVSLQNVKFLFPLGIHSDSFRSSDYYPLLPYFFLFLTGVYLGDYVKKGKFPEFLKRPIIAPLEFIGRHALIIYIVHQPIIIAVIWLVTKLSKVI